MKSAIKRQEELEKSRPGKKETQFVCWAGQKWTQKEKEMMKCKYPDVKLFWKPPTKTLPHGWQRMDKKSLELLNDLISLVNWDPEVVKKRDEEIRRRVLKEYPRSEEE